MTTEANVEKQTRTYHRILNPVLWNGIQLKDDVRTALLKIGEAFVQSWGFDIPVKDIVVTGSNASYNWNVFSDIDIHVIADMAGYPKSDKEFVAAYLKSQKQMWNQNRKIKVKGYPCELYAQDSTELLIASGVYSLTKNEWIKMPTQAVRPRPNMIAVKAKVVDFTDQITDAIMKGDEEGMLALVKKLSDLRKSGLQSKGEFSTENIAFKTLRNDGTIKRLRDALESSTDRKLTLESTNLDELDSKTYQSYRSQAKGERQGTSRASFRRFVGVLELPDRSRGIQNATDLIAKKHMAKANAEKLAKRERLAAEAKLKTESVKHPHKGPRPHKGGATKYHYVNHHKGPKTAEGGLSSADRWKKHRTAKLWAWKRNRFSRLAREKPGSEKAISHRTYMAARNLTYKAILGKRKKSKLPYGERARAERTAKRVYKLNIKNPENRVRYKYRRKDTTKHSGVSYKNP